MFTRLPVEGSITGRYLQTEGYPAPHMGVDIAAPVGTPVAAPGVGKVLAVHKVDAQNQPLDGWGDGSFGNCIVIDHEGTPWYSLYAHFQSFDPAAGVGITLLPGTRMGYVGLTGLTTGAHVHWQLSKNAGFPKDAAVSADPLSFYQPAASGGDPNVRLTNLEAEVLRLKNLMGAYGLLGPDGTTISGEPALQYANQRQFSALLSGQLANKRIAELTTTVMQLATGATDPNLRQELIDGLGALLAKLEPKK